MSKESILKIKETEALAEQMISDARVRAQKILEDARAEGIADCDHTETQTAAELSSMLNQIRARTVTMSERMAEESDEEIAQMREQVTLRRRIAEKIILRGVVKKCR